MHVLGMPPAFILSQDQTLKFDVRLPKGGIPSDNRSFQGAVPAQILHGYVYVGHASDHSPRSKPAAMIHWNGINLPSTLRLEAAGPGAAAHMSLHLKSTMSKNPPHTTADSDCSPLLLSGDSVSDHGGDQTAKQAASSGEWAYMDDFRERQPDFCTFVA